MLATALGQLSAKDVEDALRLCEKVRSRFDDEATGVLCPYVDQPLVDERRLGRGFEAKGILVVVPVVLARRSQVDDRVVSAQLIAQRRSNGTPQVIRAWPVRRAVDRAAVAQDDCRVDRLRRCFELPLYVEDRSLRRSQDVSLGCAGKSTAEHDARRFAQDVNVFAEMLANEFEDGRLASARPSCQNDSSVSMRFTTFAGQCH